MRLALLADASHVNIQRWCEGLSYAGAEIHLLSFSPSTQEGVRIYHLPFSKLPGKLHYLAAVPYTQRLIKHIQPDVLVAYYVTGYGTLGRLAGFRPLVQVTSGSDVLLAPKGFFMKHIVRYNLTGADLVTAWAVHMGDAARELGVVEKRLFVLPRGIPFQHFARNRCLRPENTEVTHIISTRSLKADYNLDLLLSALRLLENDHVPFYLTIAGEGPQRRDLVNLTRQLGLQARVQFVGFVPNDRLPSMLARHNLYVSLVASDGVSASLLEAMAIGLFPIVTNHPANHRWIRSGHNGLILNNLSAVTIASTLATAISELALRQRAWEENSRTVQKHADLYRNAEIFVQRFRRLTTEHQKVYQPVFS